MASFTLASLLALFPDAETRPDLHGPRTRGSLSEHGLDIVPGDREAVEFRPTVGNVPIARYFRVETPEIQGRLGAVPLGDLTPEQRAKVRLRDAGDHGIEFYLDVDPSEADLPPVSHVTVIVGPIDDEGTLGAWTWFPGDPMGTAMARKEFTDHPVNSIACKLHNG